jgi:UDP-glucose 4-epimerase
MKNILVTGGAGYIGSVMVKKLLDGQNRVTVIDNLSKGKKALVDKRATFYKLDILNFSALEKKFKGKKFDTIIHFAALKNAGESMINPGLYGDNITGLLNVLKLASQIKAKQFIFSSSAAVYGNPQADLIAENHPCQPTNFYGYTKLAGEQILEWFRKTTSLNYVALRYFNVAGDGGLNYLDPKAKNIFSVIADVLSGKKKFLEIFGVDYNTPDGTGIRDYIHVSDLAEAHIKALNLKGSEIINLGSEKGYSVLEIVKEFERVSGQTVPRKIVARRPGDVASCIATSAKAKKLLDWKAKLGLKEMVESTWSVYKRF